MQVAQTIIDSACAPAGSRKCAAFCTTEILWNTTQPSAFVDVNLWYDAFSQLYLWTGHFFLMVIYLCHLSPEMDPSDHDGDRAMHS